MEKKSEKQKAKKDAWLSLFAYAIGFAWTFIPNGAVAYWGIAIIWISALVLGVAITETECFGEKYSCYVGIAISILLIVIAFHFGGDIDYDPGPHLTKADM